MTECRERRRIESRRGIDAEEFVNEKTNGGVGLRRLRDPKSLIEETPGLEMRYVDREARRGPTHKARRTPGIPTLFEIGFRRAAVELQL